MELEELALEELAKQAAGNWQQFGSFSWHTKQTIPEDWTIVYTSGRDSGLLDQSNAWVIDQEMKCFAEMDDPDALSERHFHWAGGYVDGYSIRVYRDGKITEAFRAYCKLMGRLADYAALDDEDYSRREYEATIENIREVGRGIVDYDLPEGWEKDCYKWLWDNNCRAIESKDERGGYATRRELLEAINALYPDADKT